MEDVTSLGHILSFSIGVLEVASTKSFRQNRTHLFTVRQRTMAPLFFLDPLEISLFLFLLLFSLFFSIMIVDLRCYEFPIVS